MLSQGPQEGACSARECTKQAERIIRWRNPANPRPRFKEWPACLEHVDYLANYMRYRGFPYEIIPWESTPTQ